MQRVKEDVDCKDDAFCMEKPVDKKDDEYDPTGKENGKKKKKLIKKFNLSLSKYEKEEESMKSFLEAKHLTESDKRVIELYKEKKITRNKFLKYVDKKQQPVMRGKVHLLLVCLSPFWFSYMLNISTSAAMKAISLMTNICFFYNFFASFLLHNFDWEYPRLFLIEKIDHLGIFVMISGSLLPVQFVLFEKKKFIICMTLQLLSLLFGICCIIFVDFSTGSRFVRSLVYFLTGLFHAPFFLDYYMLLNSQELIYLIVLATLYVLGALFYAIKKPTVIPGFVDFHEIFHICCLGSAICTFALNCSVIKRSK